MSIVIILMNVYCNYIDECLLKFLYFLLQMMLINHCDFIFWKLFIFVQWISVI